MKWRNWINAAIGVWFIISPWALGIPDKYYAAPASVTAGLVLVIVSVWAAMRVDVPRWNIWQNWVSALCGFWFVIQPFLGEYDDIDYYFTIIPGIITISLSLWNLMMPSLETTSGRGPKART